MLLPKRGNSGTSMFANEANVEPKLFPRFPLDTGRKTPLSDASSREGFQGNVPSPVWTLTWGKGKTVVAPCLAPCLVLGDNSDGEDSPEG